MTELPEHLGYTADHEWIAITPGGEVPSGEVRVGLSAVAVEALGEIVFVELPEPGSALTAGEQYGEVESTKSVSELVSPVSGAVGSVNPALADTPELVNQDPYGEGWLFTVVVSEVGELLTAEAYAAAQAG